VPDGETTLGPIRRGGEALIQHISRCGDHTEFLLVLDDGAPSCARLGRFAAEWLELRVGDIVPVDLLGSVPCRG
jgi:hypothetical protein